MSYPMPTYNDTAGFYEFFQYVSRISEGIFFPVMLLSIWLISFITLLSTEGFRFNSASRAFMVSSLIASILGGMLAVLDLLAPKYVYLSILMLALGGLWQVLNNSRD